MDVQDEKSEYSEQTDKFNYHDQSRNCQYSGHAKEVRNFGCDGLDLAQATSCDISHDLASNNFCPIFYRERFSNMGGDWSEKVKSSNTCIDLVYWCINIVQTKPFSEQLWQCVGELDAEVGINVAEMSLWCLMGKRKANALN